MPGLSSGAPPVLPGWLFLWLAYLILDSLHLCDRTEGIALLPEPLYDVRQGLHGLAGGLCIVQQHHAEVVPLGIAADIAQDLRRIGVAGGGILRADIPVDPVVAFCSACA